MDVNTNKASFSNYGAPVDYWEPGVSVYSTYKGGGYATLSGTSMASPHACGILAVGGFASGGSVNNVPSGTTTTWGKRD
jgi:subtilisin family serine protease